MTTQSQLKDMFSAVLKANPEAHYLNGRIYLRPISQVAWVIALGTTSIPEIYHISWGPTALFIPDDWVASLRFPIMIPKPHAPSADGIQQRVLDAITEQCLSRIPTRPTLNDMYELGESKRSPVRSNIFDQDLTRAIFYYSAQGVLDQALDMSMRLISVAADVALEKLELSMRVAIRDLHPLLLAGDRKGIGALLRHHEQISVTFRNLEKFWEPAPYPVELRN